MKMTADCLPCFFSQALEVFRARGVDGPELLEGMRQVASRLSRTVDDESPPEVSRDIHRIVRHITHEEDPYAEIKERSTRLALAMEDRVQNKIRSSADPFITALRFAIAGNIMDYARMSLWNEERLEKTLAEAENVKLDLTVVESLRTRIANADSILYLADNAGEAVFDRIFLEHAGLRGSCLFAVKGSPVINDCIREDAVQSGLKEVATIIETGSDAPGTVLKDTTPKFQKLFNEAPLIIAKGQANFETLSDCPREVYLLTQIKCPVIGKRYGFETGAWVVTTSPVGGGTQ